MASVHVDKGIQSIFELETPTLSSLMSVSTRTMVSRGALWVNMDQSWHCWHSRSFIFSWDNLWFESMKRKTCKHSDWRLNAEPSERETSVTHWHTRPRYIHNILHLKLSPFVAAFFLNTSTKLVPHKHSVHVFNCRLKVKLPVSTDHSMDSYVVTKLKLHAL